MLRAESQSKNPQAEPDDIALLVAIRKNHCVGFHGLLPGLIKNKDSNAKIYWLVTFYLDTAFRGQGYGKRLVKEIQNIKADLVTTGITEAAAGVYRSEGFRKLGELPYYRLCPENTDVFTTALRNLESREKKITSKSVNQLAEEIYPTAARQDSIISFRRDIKTINWMIRNPWIVSRQNARQDVKQYYFSRVREPPDGPPILRSFRTGRNRPQRVSGSIHLPQKKRYHNKSPGLLFPRVKRPLYCRLFGDQICQRISSRST